MKLQFEITRIPELASKFDYKQEAEKEILEIKIPKVKHQGYLTLEDFLFVCKWKTQRSKPHVERNSKEDVIAITKFCLETENERLRIGGLTLLNGVDYPTASAIFHFFHNDQYPILDVRALESIGVQKPNVYTFEFWEEYVNITRKIAIETGLDMRTLAVEQG